MARAIRKRTLDDILESILKLARLDFSSPLRVDDQEGERAEVAAVAAGITMLGEELQDKIVSRDYLDQLLQSIEEMLFTLTPDRTIKRVNRSVQALLGYDREELVGVPFDELVIEESGLVPSIGQQIRSKGGALVPIALSESDILDGCGNVFEVICVVRDIADIKAVEDELKQVNQQLYQSVKLSALGELAAGVAHELNQPLNAMNLIVGGMLREIARGPFDESSLDERLTEIGTQITRMAELIAHMRAFSRTTDGEDFEALDISKVCGSALTLFQPHCDTYGIEIVAELAPLPPVLGNSIRLEQMFINLIANACHAVENVGEVNKRIRVAAFESHRSLAAAAAVNVEISDNGPGVPDSLAQKIFEPFFTTKQPGDGTGLGLSIARKIIEDHQGSITLTSRMGEGTTFRVALPIRSPADD
jgi:signal transduction histidine kinase